MQNKLLRIHGPQLPAWPVLLDAPHSGLSMPAAIGAALPAADLREGQDCFIDELWMPATARGIPWRAAKFARICLDPHRHAGDLDPDLLDAPWRDGLMPSGKAGIGKALIWRTLDDRRPIYNRKLCLQEVRQRIDRCHARWQQALRGLLDAAHAAHGVVYHLNCHSMNAASGLMGEAGAGILRADRVSGDVMASPARPNSPPSCAAR